jgi:EAL and modified HD-GYP domain-containing signal transduction protein
MTKSASQEAPGAAAAAATISVARQPIFNARCEVVAFELLYRSSPQAVSTEPIDGTLATARVVLGALSDIGLDRLAPGVRVHVNLPDALLREPLALPLPPERVIVEVLEDVSVDEPLLAGIAALRDQGFRIALDDYVSHACDRRLLAVADCVKVDLAAEPPESLARTVETLRARGLELIAEKVETREQFERCKALGFTAFQGYFLQRPETFSGQRAPTLRLATLQVLAALNQPDVTPEQLEQLVARDLGLVNRLLRCLNSGYYNLPRKVTSIRHGIVMLGLENLKRLCSVVALAGFEDRPNYLLINAMVRARMCELMAERRDPQAAGSFFFAGLLSHIDALLGLPTDEVVRSLPLTSDVESALTRQAGPIGEALRAVQAWERGEWERVREVGDGAAVRAAYLEALRWAEEARQMLA